MTKKRIIALATFVGLILGLSLTLLGVNNWKPYNFNERNYYFKVYKTWDEPTRKHVWVIGETFDESKELSIYELSSEAIIEPLEKRNVYLKTTDLLSPYKKATRGETTIYETKGGNYIIKVVNVKFKFTPKEYIRVIL